MTTPKHTPKTPEHSFKHLNRVWVANIVQYMFSILNKLYKNPEQREHVLNMV